MDIIQMALSAKNVMRNFKNVIQAQIAVNANSYTKTLIIKKK